MPRNVWHYPPMKKRRADPQWADPLLVHVLILISLRPCRRWWWLAPTELTAVLNGQLTQLLELGQVALHLFL